MQRVYHKPIQWDRKEVILGRAINVDANQGWIQDLLKGGCGFIKQSHRSWGLGGSLLAPKSDPGANPLEAKNNRVPFAQIAKHNKCETQ